MAFLHVIVFSSEHQQPHVLMSNPCGAVHQPLRRTILPSTKEMILLTNPETGYEKAHRQAEQIFREVFPARGMTVREGQIQLCHTMLDALFGRDVALCDAGVGLGKTYAYLLACVLWQLQRPRQMQRPVVISTASITLQNAILEDYIPFLSDVLIQNGYIADPICAVLRKGKERFVCDMRLLLRQKQISARGKRFRKRAIALREARQCVDLDRLPNLPRHERRLICVPNRCDRSCIAHSDCRYRQYLKASNGLSVTIQVCNHNYLLADAAHRQNGWTPLLKDYQALVIDEAHKLPETVRQMNTWRICSAELLTCEKLLIAGHFGLSAQKLRAVTREFLTAFVPPEKKAERAIPLQQTEAGTAALQHLDKMIAEILKQRPEAMPQGLRGKLSGIQQLIPLFLGTDSTFVRYLTWHRESDRAGVELCAVPFDLPKCLSSALWDEQKPAILTSGTLAVGEDFSHAEKRLGLDRGTLLRTLKVLSPFDYEKNCMLYFPESPRGKSEPDEERIARQIEELIYAANGHTLVLFTSYDQMGHVYEKLKDKLPLPVLQYRYVHLPAFLHPSWTYFFRRRPFPQSRSIYNSSSNCPMRFCSQAVPAGKGWTSQEIWFLCLWFRGCHSRCLTRWEKLCGHSIEISTVTSRPRSCPKCRSSCARGLAVPSAPKRTAAWWRSSTLAQPPVGATTGRCWTHCRK